jgi:hypothetical protein
MDEPLPAKEAGEIKPVFKRPVILTALCLAAFVHFGLLAMLLLFAVFRSEWITQVVNRYLANDGGTGTRPLFLFGSGFALHTMAFAGVYLMWKLRKAGYFIFAISCLAIAIYQLFNPLATVASTGLYISFLLLFSLFFRRLQ